MDAPNSLKEALLLYQKRKEEAERLLPHVEICRQALQDAEKASSEAWREARIARDWVNGWFGKCDVDKEFK